MSSESTVATRVLIDVSPDGILFTIEGLDADLANLIAKAGAYEVLGNEYHTYDTNTIQIRSVRAIAFLKRPPVLSEPEAVGTDTEDPQVHIGPKENTSEAEAWASSIKNVYMNGLVAAWEVSGAKVIISNPPTTPGSYIFRIEATGYIDALVTYE